MGREPSWRASLYGPTSSSSTTGPWTLTSWTIFGSLMISQFTTFATHVLLEVVVLVLLLGLLAPEAPTLPSVLAVVGVEEAVLVHVLEETWRTASQTSWRR